MSWINELLACPKCESRLGDGEGGWTCARCGDVGRNSLGYPDFLSTSVLPMAAGASLDLEADKDLATALHEKASRRDFAELCELHKSLRHQRGGGIPSRSRSAARIIRRMERVSSEGAPRGGDAMLAKIDARLREIGWPELGHGAVLEAGGGEGLFLPAFSRRFSRVVFLDASLTNIVLAAKLAEEQELENVAYVRADVMNLPFRTGLFDVVHQNGVIEHVDDPLRMVAESLRVRASDGYYICVSPNRMSILPEPHFGIPAFGFIPPPLRARLVPLVRGAPLQRLGTDPRSLRQLRRCLDKAGSRRTEIFFLPRQLAFTARQTPVRRVVRRCLGLPGVGKALEMTLNRLLLPVVPQHIALANATATPSSIKVGA